MRIGLRAHDLGFQTPENLRKELTRLGVDTIQLAMHKSFEEIKGYPYITEKQLENVKAARLDISVLGCYINPSEADAVLWQEEMHKFECALQIAEKLNASCVGTETGDCIERDRENQLKRVYNSVEHLLPFAERYKTPIAIEAVIRHTVNKPETLVKMIESFNSPYLKIIFDPVNLLKDDNSNNTLSFFKETLDMYQGRIIAMHVKDRNLNGLCPLGEGVMKDIYPELSKLLPENLPLIREEMPPISIPEDIEYIRRVFSR